ncbi:hypothetical protein SHKM778_21690 [Streptomyces sp. KM77-8]|uniref:Lipoprotein n=1 Tax=Streptomyces haneummycinicus TaxID=3074435 RepID=A0AAT9HEQ5_9ACTN
MSFPLSPRARSGPRRRSLLAAAPAALLAAGCSAGSGSPAPPPTAVPRPPTGHARVRPGTAGNWPRGTTRSWPRIRSWRSGSIRCARRSYGTRRRSGTPRGRRRPGPPRPPPASPSPAATVPAKEKDALAGLAAAEREIAGRREKELLDAPGELARLLASVAAAGAAHVYLLTEA